jgi:hypothetical protein
MLQRQPTQAINIPEKYHFFDTPDCFIYLTTVYSEYTNVLRKIFVLYSYHVEGKAKSERIRDRNSFKHLAEWIVLL